MTPTSTGIKTFNTGRHYTGQGQRIHWMCILPETGDPYILFWDQDRGIYGRITPTLSSDIPAEIHTDLDVLYAYDHGFYCCDSSEQMTAMVKIIRSR